MHWYPRVRIHIPPLRRRRQPASRRGKLLGKRVFPDTVTGSAKNSLQHGVPWCV